MKKKTISIIGGGYTGIISALLLSKLKNKEGHPLYDISLIESKKELLLGASNKIARLHMGGEYPLDKETSKNCVIGSVLFSQIFNKDHFSSPVSGINYFLTKESCKKEILSLEDMISSYQENIVLYSKLFNIVKKMYPERELVGDPKDFFSVVNFSDSDVFVGGIKSKELGIDSEKFNKFLTSEVLKRSDIKVYTDSFVSNVSKQEEGFNININNTKEFYSDIVVNASWESSFFLDQKVGNPVKRKAFLRALAVADISSCLEKGESTFALIGKDGCMYSRVNDKSAILYVPDKEISHILDSEISQENSKLQDYFFSNEDIENLKTKFYNHVVNIFPNLKEMVIDSIKINQTFSFDDVLEKRRHFNTKIITNNWYSLLPTKATFSAWSVLELIKLMHPEILENFDPETNPAVPDFLIFK